MRQSSIVPKLLLVPACLLALIGPSTPLAAHSSAGFPEDTGTNALPRAAGAGNDLAFINFETPHVHPIDISPDGLWLAACNTPDGRVEIYSINQGTGMLTQTSSVTVGVDPVSVRWRTNTEVWAVNAVSDSISIIDRTIGQVTNTIVTYRLVDTGDRLDGSPNGDRPMDVVFINAGALAVVSCTTTDRLQLYDTATRALLDEDLHVDGEEPRALATDGTAVWAAIFESGNGTTLISGIDGSAGFPGSASVTSAANPYGGDPTGVRGSGEFFHSALPADGDGWNVRGAPGGFVSPSDLDYPTPRSGVIVRSDGAGAWLDDNGQNWASFISGANAGLSGRMSGWTMLDNDIVRVTQFGGNLGEHGPFGTNGYVTRQMNIVMAIALNPVTDEIWTVGTDATNEIRFEPNITGTFTRVMLSVVAEANGAQVLLTDVNEAHLATAQGGNAYADAVVSDTAREDSLGDPRGIAFTPDGLWAYISGMGSNNLIVVDASGAGIGTRVSAGDTIEVPQGPTGLAHHPTLNFLYVMSKFASQITVLNTTTPGSETTVQTMGMFDPTPTPIKNGRLSLYGTHENSGLGQIACASCHVDGRMDRLGWNLGNPAHVDGESGLQGIEKLFHGLNDGLIVAPNPGPNPVGRHNNLINAEGSFDNFSSMKGVMTTQTLQDIIGKEPHHWRGDRDGIEEFAGAFSGLQGGATLPGPAMADFKALLASIWFEPNPLRPLDNALPGGPPFSEVFTGDHEPLDITGQFSPGTTTGKNGFSALGTQLPPGDAFAGFDRYVDTATDSTASCVICHTLPMGAGSTHFLSNLANMPITFNASAIPPSTLGSAHQALTIDGTGQDHFKVPHYRNEIEKDGFYLNLGGSSPPSRAGFGVLHDGAIDGLARFIAEPAFQSVNSDPDLANLVAFTLAVRGDDFFRLQGLPGAPTGGIPPAAITQDAHAAVGAQAVAPLGVDNLFTNVLVDVADDDEIDLVAEVRTNNTRRRFVHFDNDGNDTRFMSDRATEGLVTRTTLENLGVDILYTGLHESTGRRIGVDRDEDGGLDGDEATLGSSETNSGDNAFVGSSIPPAVNALHSSTTVNGGLALVTATPGRRSILHIQGGVYTGVTTINEPVVLRKMVDPTTGQGVGGNVVIGN